MLPQFMARNALATSAHTPYSLDLPHSDSYLFADMKGLLRGGSFMSGERWLFVVEGVDGPSYM
jgi:hypothetical protein